MPGNSTLEQQILGLQLPKPGEAVPDYVIGAIYGIFASIVAWIAWWAFSKKKPIGSPYINLHFFALARCVGYILRGVVDDQTPLDTWGVSEWTDYTTILTTAYSIITAGTTLFLFFMSIISVHFRRTCEASSPRGTDFEEDKRQKSEGRFLWIFRVIVIALAVVAAIGSVREFNPYWFNFKQGSQMRKAVALIQIALTLGMVIYVTSVYASHRFPGRATRAYFIVNTIFVLMLITQAYNILRVFNNLTAKVNADPNYGYLLQVLPELLLLSLVLVGRLDSAIDYDAIRSEQYAGGDWGKH